MATTTTPLAMTVCDATLDDAQEIADLGTKVFTLSFGHTVEPDELRAYLSRSYSTQAIITDLLNPAKTTLLAITTDPHMPAGNKILGFAQLNRSSGASEPCIALLGATAAVELQRIYVRSDMHGKGVGKLLAGELEGRAKGEGFRYMWLGVWEENLRARRLYEGLGFERVGEHEFRIGGVVQMDDIMVKRL